ncbi:hemolysin family protein [Pararobbsia silviterrae]|uniref:HlyC/CorC family transporter n=1 Tax=Pararobbsia silviterrae TaxID=1792498 RepID=A0A494Y8H2_9BURK|nr:hemolysin family protein [Pararobbsia silviterrae]RKP58944.1 HlyC/CorC family transporter [Pararobbsia silviterrae]
METFLSLIAALLLVALNGFFVAAEFALVKLRATRVAAIATQYGWRGRLLRRVHGHLDAYLSACQLGITLASLGLGWLGEPAFAHLLEPVFRAFGVEHAVGDAIALAFAFILISFLHIVAGELAPKSLAIRVPERMGLLTAAPLYVFHWIMYPAIALLNACANRILTAFGLTAAGHADEPYGEDELRVILRGSERPRQFTRDEWNTLSHSLEFGQLTSSDLMRPLRDAVGFDVGDTFEKVVAVARVQRFSRYPLFGEDGDTVVGMIDLADLLFAQADHREALALTDLMRPVLHVLPETPALELLREFRAGAPHFAVVGRPTLAPIGFVTLSDLASALVGQIKDDVRTTPVEWARLPDGSVEGQASLTIVSLEHVLGVHFGEQLAESVGGMILDRLGELPLPGQVIEFEPATITVKALVGPRIGTVVVCPKDAATELED